MATRYAVTSAFDFLGVHYKPGDTFVPPAGVVLEPPGVGEENLKGIRFSHVVKNSEAPYSEKKYVVLPLEVPS